MGESGRFPDRVDAALELRTAPGREREVAAFRHWLESSPPGAGLHVRGPGGIGKSTLLRALRAEAERGAGRAVLLDLRQVPAQASAAEAALTAAVDALGASGGAVLLDSFESHVRLEPWYRSQLQKQREVPVRWVLAGRRALQRAWLHGAEAVHELTVQRLQPLSPDACRALLRSLPEALLEHAVALSLGHPGAVTESLRLVRAGVQQPSVLLDKVYGAVVESSDAAPGVLHAEALRVAALVPALDRRLLAAALDTPEAGRLFEWLSGHSSIHAADARLVMDPLLAQALRRDYQLSQPEAYARRVLQLGRLLAERLERANRAETRQAAVDGLLRLGHQPADVPLLAAQVEVLSAEATRTLLSRERPELLLGLDLRGRVQCQLVCDAHGELLGCVLLSDPRSRTLRQHPQARAMRALLAARAVGSAERVLLLEPTVFPEGPTRESAARAVFEVAARLMHADRRLSVGVLACTPEDQALRAFAVQLDMLSPLSSVPQAAAEGAGSLWFCDHAKRGAAACLYGRLVDRHVPRGQTVVA